MVEVLGTAQTSKDFTLVLIQIVLVGEKRKLAKKIMDLIMSSSRENTEPAHEIMAIFVLRKLILKTRMRSHPVGLDV